MLTHLCTGLDLLRFVYRYIYMYIYIKSRVISQRKDVNAVGMLAILTLNTQPEREGETDRQKAAEGEGGGSSQ